MTEEFGYIQFPPGMSLEDAKRFREKFNGLMASSGAKFVPFRPQIQVEHKPVLITPPTLFTNEMLEQIRAVMREELQVAKKQTVWTPEDEDTFLRGVLRSRLNLGVMSLSEYRVELARLDKQKIQACDTSTDEQEAFLKGQRQAI